SASINTTVPVTISLVGAFTGTPTTFTATSTTAFITDSTPQYTFNGFGATICLGSGTVYFGGTNCGSGALHDTFSNIATITGGADNDTFVAASGNWNLFAGSGSETIDFSGATAGVTVSLASGSVSGGGYTGTMTLHSFGSVVGSQYADSITGSTTVPGVLNGGGGNNTFFISGGMEVVNGGTGTNTLDLSNALSAITLDLTLHGFQSTGGAGLLEVVPGTIQIVIGSPFGSNILGSSAVTTITGTSSSSDTINAGSGTNTTINAGSGTDTLIAGSGTVVINGGSGADTYQPGSGSLTINAGSGTSGLSFANAPAGVKVNLSGTSQTVNLPDAGVASVTLPRLSVSGGWGGSVVLPANITTVIGSPFADVIIGVTGSMIDGGTGADVLVGIGGGVTIKSEGTAVIATGLSGSQTGSDTVTCTGGSCTVDYEWMTPDTANDGVTVNLQTGAAQKCGWAQLKAGESASCTASGTDTLSGVTTVFGTSGADKLVANAANQTLQGLGGINIDNNQDSMTASSAGYDTLVGGNGGGVFLGNGGGHDTMTGGSGPDTYFAQIFNGSAETTTQAFDTIQMGGQNDFVEGDSSDAYSGLSNVAPQTLEYITGWNGSTPIEARISPIP
ncbi:MAG TPA: hypothetical protein VNF07_06885, partial [Acidimicrobiales bacterium]|nr:hypothetical protein [Acidimicrobiales bacterium]